MNYYVEILPQYFSYFLIGTRNTIILALATVLLGSLLGSLIALLRVSSNKILSCISRVYISIIRGTPLIVQLYIGYFQLGKWIAFPDVILLGLDMQRVLPCLMVLGLNSGAYIAELIRSGIQAVDKGQLEAARSIGMTKSMAMKTVVLPQAIRNILPAIGNEFITMIKETAVIQYLGVADLMYNTGSVITSSYVVLPNYYFAAVIYFVLTFTASALVNQFERRLQSNDKR